MENICLEAIWKTRLTELGWSKEATSYYSKSLAPSSLSEYNKHILEFYSYCKSNGVLVFQSQSAVAKIPSFLCQKAKKSQRPESVLRTIAAALKHYFSACLLYDQIDSHIQRLITGLVKCETSLPRSRTKVMPIEPFIDLFISWGKNYNLSLKQLRLKTVTLLTIALLCRPSDLAPKVIFKRSQVVFKESEMVVSFFGIKNDSHRDGFVVNV